MSVELGRKASVEEGLVSLEDNDEDLLGYALIHADTPRALFHRDHVARILKLAGKSVPERLPEFVAVHSETMEPLVKEARRRMSQPKLTLVP